VIKKKEKILFNFMKFLDPATILELDVNIFTKVNKADKPKVIYNFFQLIMLD